MRDFDIALTGPPVIGIMADERHWLRDPGKVMRIRGVDLREVAHRAEAIREDRPGVPVLVDIDVMIAHHSHDARAAMADRTEVCRRGDTLLYVGTPAGLAGLIADIHTLAIADGAVLIPIVRSVVTLIHNEVLPMLDAVVRRANRTREQRPA